MALDHRSRYPGQVDVGDSGYPLGRARNVATEGDGTGFPLEKDFVNDLLGWQQALLLAADIEPSETPDTATASQYLLSFYRLIRRVDGWGALGNDSADDTGALQAALNDVAAYGPGRQELHLVPGKTYRHTGLSVPVNVDIIGHGAILAINHASNHALTYSGTVVNNPHPQRISGVIFSAVVANTGAAIRLAANGGFYVHDCYFGKSSNALGKFIEVVSGVNLTVKMTVFDGWGNTPQIDYKGGYLRLEDCRHIIPGTYSSDCVKVGSATVAWLTRGLFELVAHSSGTMSCYRISGVSKVHLEDNEYLNNSDLAVVNALQWDAAAWIQESGSSYNGDVVPYAPAAGVTLADGSHLGLVPHKFTTYTDATCELPAGVARAVSRSTEGAGAISLEFPVGYFPGQHFEHSLSTTYSAGVTVPTIGGSVPVMHGPTLGLTAGGAQSGAFVWIDPAGGTSYRWVQVSPWIGVS